MVMTTDGKIRLYGGAAAAVVMVFVATQTEFLSKKPRLEPKLVFGSYHPENGIASLTLTNSTKRRWNFSVPLIRGFPRPEYYLLTPRERKSEWALESLEGINGPGFLYEWDGVRYQPRIKVKPNGASLSGLVGEKTREN